MASCRWDTGDSATWAPQLPPESADLVFTCPPYYDTEVYSSGATDLSTMGTGAFEDAYATIMAGVGRALRPDRFAVVVTGDSRGKDGYLRDLRGATVRAMAAAGCGYCSGAVHVRRSGRWPAPRRGSSAPGAPSAASTRT